MTRYLIMHRVMQIYSFPEIESFEKENPTGDLMTSKINNFESVNYDSKQQKCPILKNSEML